MMSVAHERPSRLNRHLTHLATKLSVADFCTIFNSVRYVRHRDELFDSFLHRAEPEKVLSFIEHCSRVMDERQQLLVIKGLHAAQDRVKNALVLDRPVLLIEGWELRA
jgi:hypothetical protein